MDEIAHRLSQNLRALRTRGGLTQEQLADRAGLRVAQISRLENGANTTLATVQALANGLGVDPVELLQPTDRPRSARPELPGLSTLSPTVQAAIASLVVSLANDQGDLGVG